MITTTVANPHIPIITATKAITIWSLLFVFFYRTPHIDNTIVYLVIEFNQFFLLYEDNLLYITYKWVIECHRYFLPWITSRASYSILLTLSFFWVWWQKSSPSLNRLSIASQSSFEHFEKFIEPRVTALLHLSVSMETRGKLALIGWGRASSHSQVYFLMLVEVVLLLLLLRW